ncbi:MAG: hypothetical protein QXY75_05010 [Candidatus Bathyarchaeia archaeon]
MDKISIFLALINLIVATGPMLSILVIHISNPIEVIVPSEVQGLSETLGSFGGTLQTIELVNVTYNPDSRTITLLFSVISGLDIDLRIDSITADIVCATHGYTLGHASLMSPVTLVPHIKSYLTVQSHWTYEAEQHIKGQHNGESTINVNLANIAVNVDGVVIQTSQPVTLTNIPIGSLEG